MKAEYPIRFFKLTFLVILLIASYTSVTFAETYKLDPVHTSIIFRVKHLGVSYFYGRFNGASGIFSFDETAPSQSSIEMQVSTNNIDTNVEKRDNHLKSPDFLNVQKHPLIKFQSNSVKQLDTANYEIKGDLTLLGKTRPLTITAVHTGSGKDPWGNFRSGFKTSFIIKRSDFGMDFMLGGVSDEVQLTVSIEGIRQ